MLKIRLAMESSGNNPMDGDIQVDKFTSGGKEEKKQGSVITSYSIHYTKLYELFVERFKATFNFVVFIPC